MKKENNAQITFDKVHTKKKQMQLQNMMHQVSEKIRNMTENAEVSFSCPICKSSSIHAFTKKYGFNLDICSMCNHIFCNPMPSEQQLDIYYNSEMKEFENEFFLESFENRIPIFSKRISIIKEYIKSGKLLDVGSAIGIFIEALKRDRSNFQIACCDPSVDACMKLSERYSEVETFNSLIEHLDKTSEYDLVTMWDTIEHIREPESVALNIKKVLKKGGYWFFSTPNTKSFEWEIAGTNHVQILPPGHINLFNLESIQALLVKTGFELVDYHTPNGSLDVTYVQKFLKENNSETIGSFLQKNIYDIEFAESFSELLSKSKLAGNIFVIARKV